MIAAMRTLVAAAVVAVVACNDEPAELWADRVVTLGRWSEAWARSCGAEWAHEEPQRVWTLLCTPIFPEVVGYDCRAPVDRPWDRKACKAAIDALPCGSTHLPAACEPVWPYGRPR